MARDDWFRNTEWNEIISARFEEKFKRAKRKSEYLYIQACTLTSTYPAVSIELIKRYFEIDSHFRDSAAYVCHAEALLTLERVEEAMASYEAALQSEVKFPYLHTSAYVDYPYIVAVRLLRSHFEKAIRILDERRRETMFPIELFKWHAAKALILFAKGEHKEASEQAKAALDAAQLTKSWARNHPMIGLVTEKHRDVIERLHGLTVGVH